MLLLYILWLTNFFFISGSNEQIQQQSEYILQKPDYHSWWFSKMQSGREDTLEERCAIKFYFKLGKDATKTFGMLQTAFRPSCMNRASVFEWHKKFKEGRESVRHNERWSSDQLERRCWNEEHVPERLAHPPTIEQPRRTGKKRCCGHKSGGQYVTVLFSLQLTSHTVKPLVTLSNPFK